MTISIIQSESNLFSIEVRGDEARDRLLSDLARVELDNLISDIMLSEARIAELNEQRRQENAEREAIINIESAMRNQVLDNNKRRREEYEALPWYKQMFADVPVAEPLPEFTKRSTSFYGGDLRCINHYKEQFDVVIRACKAAEQAKETGEEFYFHHSVRNLKHSVILTIVNGDRVIY